MGKEPYKVWADRFVAYKAYLDNCREWSKYREDKEDKPKARILFNHYTEEYKIQYPDGYALVDADGTLIKAEKYEDDEGI